MRVICHVRLGQFDVSTYVIEPALLGKQHGQSAMNPRLFAVLVVSGRDSEGGL